MKKLVSLILFFYILTCLSSLLSQENPLWMRYPVISPDGQAIVFSYQGDLYRVSSQGGEARILTLHEAYDYMPVWSEDGQMIAFASDRYGNFDVFVMPSMGGKAERLTYHSAHDYPSDFHPDNNSVIFSSSRLDSYTNQQFPSGVLPELYQIPITGGMPQQIISTPAEWAQFNSMGTHIVFQDRKGYEDPLRKHHTSSVTRDIWVYDIQNKTYEQISSFEGEDRNPIFAANGEDIYFLSEAEGDFNIFQTSLSQVGTQNKLTSFEQHPIRFLSSSQEGTLCFGFHGQIYTMRVGEEPKAVPIWIRQDERYNTEEIIAINKNINQMAVAPNGKEIAFIVRGEVFVASVENGTTKRITDTPEQERSVSFSPDGRSLLYASEREGSWNLYQASIAREEESYFFNSTLIDEVAILNNNQETFQASYSPDGKEVAFLEERTTLKVINLETKKIREILSGDYNYSYSDGDQHYEWSPDGKWFLVDFIPTQQWISEVGLIQADGSGTIINLTESGYFDYSARWMMEGKMMMWFSDRDGLKPDASWGGESDVYAMFFNQEDYDLFQMDKEDYEILKEKEEEEQKEEDEDKKKKEDSEEEEKLKSLRIDLEGIENRKVKLTIHSSNLADALVSKDGEKLFYLTQFESGYDLWQTNLRSKETKILSKLGAKYVGNMILDEEGKYIFILAGGRIHKIGVEDGKKSSIAIQGEMNLDKQQERAYLFEHIWRQVLKKFYVPDLHGVDWDFYKQAYAAVLPAINNNYDFQEMLSELLGELNASHTGARFRPFASNQDATASLGVFFEQDNLASGLKIVEIMDKSPLVKDKSKAKEGSIIEKIDGNEINPNTNPYQFLNRKAGKKVLLSFYDPDTRERWEEIIEPISLGQERELLYQRWVENCREIVTQLSNGEIGYVHVRGMNDYSYRTVYEEVIGENAQKKALIVDTRFNGGGWLHDDLITLLDGKNYFYFRPRGQNIGSEPMFKWTKPSVVVMSESNYSDAHMFPMAYKALEIGKLIGMPVPGTGTAVWWERLQNGMVFGIPQVGVLDQYGNYLENNQLEPDIKIPNEPGKVSQGQDQQLEAAVLELQSQIQD